MSQYLVLSHIDIQNANSIAGMTWGFPAITQFLGFTHALNRKLSKQYDGEHEITLTGCAVISHATQNKVYQPKKYADFEFLQSKNPPVLAKHKSSSPPIIEEGKLNLSVSLIIELDQSLALTTEQIKHFEKQVCVLCCRMRIAGGTVLNIEQVKFLSASTQLQHDNLIKKVKRLTMPGFVLLDRSAYLQEHHQSLLSNFEEANNQQAPELLDAWLDFSALKYKSLALLEEGQLEPDESTFAVWEAVAKPKTGYLVPLMTGYKAISELYEPGDVLNTRDESTHSRFVEAIHSIGEWKGMHSTKTIADIIWRYQHDDQWYLCTQTSSTNTGENLDAKMKELEPTQTLNLNEALNLF